MGKCVTFAVLSPNHHEVSLHFFALCSPCRAEQSVLFHRPLIFKRPINCLSKYGANVAICVASVSDRGQSGRAMCDFLLSCTVVQGPLTGSRRFGAI
jgi:hypothetical protein